MGSRLKLLAVPAAVAAMVAASAGTAMAGTFFASPQGDGKFPCERPDPCPLPYALDQAGDLDEVVVLPGTYQLAEALEIEFGKVHGVRSKPARLIGDPAGIRTSFGHPRVSDLVVRTTEDSAVNAGLGEARYERIRAVSADDTAPACTVPESPGFIHNTACVNSGGGPGVGISVFAGGTLTIEYELLNVTALATSTSSPTAFGASFTAGGGLTMAPYVANSILAGGDSASDVHTERGAMTSTVELVLDHDALDTNDQGMGTTITFAGGNELGEPAFVNPGTFDLRQLATSPTINGGVASPDHGELGRFDFEGERRTFGRRPDIGADEFTGIVHLTARRRQDRDRIKFKATCPLTKCRLKAKGEGLRTKRARLRAGRPETIRMKADSGGPDGKRVKIRVRVRDAVGARQRESLRIRLR
jgi:hypothetical protein